MDKELKKSIIISAALVLLLIIILVIPGRKVAINIISLVVILVLVALVWVRQLKGPLLNKNIKIDDDVKTRTGLICEQSGVYSCQSHPDRSVEMEEGKRFPPCLGDGKGHSAVWELQK